MLVNKNGIDEEQLFDMISGKGFMLDTFRNFYFPIEGDKIYITPKHTQNKYPAFRTRKSIGYLTEIRVTAQTCPKQYLPVIEYNELDTENMCIKLYRNTTPEQRAELNEWNNSLCATVPIYEAEDEQIIPENVKRNNNPAAYPSYIDQVHNRLYVYDRKSKQSYYLKCNLYDEYRDEEISKSTILSGEVFQLDPTKQFKGHCYNKENEVGIRMVLTFPPYRKVKGLHEYIARLSELKVNHPTGFVTKTQKLRASIDILNGEIIVDDGQYPIRTTYISVPMHKVDKQDDSITLKFGDCYGINAYCDTDSKRLYICINNEQYKNKYYYVNLDFDDNDGNNLLANNDK